MEMRNKSKASNGIPIDIGVPQQGLIAPIMQVFLSIETGLKIRNADYNPRRSPSKYTVKPTKQKFGNKVIQCSEQS